MRRVLVGVVLLVAQVAPVWAEQQTADEKLAWEAAQALYGEGLAIKRAGGKVTIAPKPGGLTQETWNVYVEKFYLPQIVKASVHRQGAWRWAERDVAKKQAKLVGKAKVAFAEEAFGLYQVREPAKGPIDCKKSYFIAYTPRGQNFVVGIRFDDKACASYTTGGGNTTERDMAWVYPQCAMILTPGHHKLEVGIYTALNGGSYDRLEVREGKVKDVKYDLVDTGKKLTSAGIECDAK